MSVWKRFQRVGKRAAKYQYTASYTELSIETNNFKPSKLVITWLRRNRKYTSEPIHLLSVPLKQDFYSYVWEVPRNEEIQTTLYKMKKDVEFNEKDWTFQLEDISDSGTRRRLLAYRNINIAQYADAVPTQNNIKINFKLSSKKLKSATLYLTLSAVFLREGDATDEDMISVASLMSLPSSQNFHLPSNDIAVLSDLDDMTMSVTTDSIIDINDKINELCGQIGSLDWDTDSLSEQASVSKDSPANSLINQDIYESDPHVISRSSTIKVDYLDDRLFSIAEDDHTNDLESNSTSNLLEWCQSITKDYRDVKVTNFTTSFRNGMAFCAIIHHFHPTLIDFDSLRPSNVKENNRIASTVASSLGIPKVLNPNEMSFLKVPDQLFVMTYLHQLRMLFTDNNLVITPASIGNNSESNYTKQSSSIPITPIEIKNTNNIDFSTYDDPTEKKLPTPIQSVPELKTELNHPFENQITKINENQITKINDNQITNINENLNTKINENQIININENQFTKINENQNTKINETDSISQFVEPVQIRSAKSKSPKKPKKILSSFNVDGTVKDKWSLSEKKIKPVTLGTLNMFSEYDTKENQTRLSPHSVQSNGHSISPSFSKKPIQQDKIDDNYIVAETLALEREQDKIDEEASKLERQIRVVIGKDKLKESVLMDKWFQLVNKKNALIRRNMQLQILDKEQNLERRWNLLQDELRQIMNVEEWSKTEEMKRREDLLMKDLVSIINQRDKVVKELDEYEKRIATELEWASDNQDAIINPNIYQKSLLNAKFSDKNCTIQ